MSKVRKFGKGKARRYAEGGDVVEDFAEDANDRTQDEANKGKYAQSESYKAEPDSFVGAKQGFKEAFAAARRAGDKTFKWQGKTYTTELKSSTPTATKAKSTSSSSTPAAAPQPRRETTTAAPKAEAPAKRKMELPKVEYTDEMNDALMNAFGGAGLAKMAGKELARAAELRAAAKIREGGKALKEAAQGAKKVINYTKDLEPTFKRGGSVGSSASRRADGIAVRGKTKGRMV